MKDLDLFIGDKYKYSNTILRSSDKIEITCPKHGVFLQRPHDHYINKNGCPACGRSTKTSEKWEEQIKKVWNDTYEYLDKYTLQHIPIRIKCHQHGIFQLKPKVHLRGRGCPTCSKENKLHNGWSVSKWSEISKASKSFDSFKVYIIKCFDETGEGFIKVGRTFLKLNCRFHNCSLPYNYKIINIFYFEDAFKCAEKEVNILKHLKEFKYNPLKDFGGKTECFSLECLSSLEAYLNN